jgi:Spy/CpxP family protein refolding chaperone
MKQHSLLTFALAAVIVSGLGAAALAQAPAAGASGPRQRQRGMALRQGPLALARLGLARLNLTGQQRDQVRTIVSNHRADMRKLSERAAPARQALQDAVVAGDEAAIRQRSAEIGTIETDKALLAARVRAEVLKVLTPEQQEKARALRKEFEDRRAERRGRTARGR